MKKVILQANVPTENNNVYPGEMLASALPTEGLYKHYLTGKPLDRAAYVTVDCAGKDCAPGDHFEVKFSHLPWGSSTMVRVARSELVEKIRLTGIPPQHAHAFKVNVLYYDCERDILQIEVPATSYRAAARMEVLLTGIMTVKAIEG